MITLTTTKAKLLFVEVEDDARNIRIDGRYIYFQVEPKGDDDGLSEFYPDCCPLPSGSTYTFLFTTKQGREEDWKGVVQSVAYDLPPAPSNDFCGDWSVGYRDYQSDEETGCSEYPFFHTATSSGLSLQKANGMDVNKNYAVIEIKN